MRFDRDTARRLVRDDAVAWLRDLPGVTGVDVGLRLAGGRFTNEPAVVVGVKEKVPARDLPPAALVPATVAGLRTDVQEAVDATLIRPAGDTAHYRPLRSGIAIALDSVNYGTLGFFATHTASKKRVLVSNYHILYWDRDLLLPSDPHPVFQPHSGPDNKVADMSGTAGGGQVGGEVDCAYATLVEETCCCCCKRVIGHENKVGATTITGVNHAAVGEFVSKTGMATGRTVGKVVNVAKDVNGTVDYSRFNLPAGSSFSFQDLIMVVSWDQPTDTATPTVPFSASGDSGAALLNTANEIVGLHMFGFQQPATGFHYSLACHIDKVETALGVQVTGGTRFAAVTPPAPSGALAALDPAVGGGDVVVAGTQADLTTAWERLRETLGETEAGREWLAFLDGHHYEVARLVNHCRPVTVRWHRVQGPAFTAALVRSARVPEYVLPAEIRGVTPADLVDAMAEVLTEHGSEALRAHVARLHPRAKAALRGDDTAAALAARLAVTP